MLKRIFDITASSVGLLILSPLFIVVAIWIKGDSRGPVFYRQIRVGRGGRDFGLLKFRSMRADGSTGPLITIGEDPRITRSGHFIRKYKLDELPQLINVIKGDMSLVGPRPEVRHYVDMYTPEQMHVLDVRPGITSLASIKYCDESEVLAQAEDPERTYIEKIMPEKIAIDLEYVKHAGLLYDLRLILGTLAAIVNK